MSFTAFGVLQNLCRILDNLEIEVQKNRAGLLPVPGILSFEHLRSCRTSRTRLRDPPRPHSAFGNRIERDATVGGTTTIEKFVVDGWDTAKPRAVGTENFDTILDLDGAGSVTTRRLFGGGFDDVAGRQDVAGGVAWYATDRLGSVRQVFDNAGK